MDAEPESFGQDVTVKAAPGKIPSSAVSPNQNVIAKFGIH